MFIAYATEKPHKLRRYFTPWYVFSALARRRSADFPVCRIAGFLTCRPWESRIRFERSGRL